MLLPLLYFEATEAVLLYLVSGVALKVETSRWLSSGKLVAPKEDNIQLLFFRLPPGYPRKKAARFFMPDGFLRNVIAQIIFFCGCWLRKALILQCSY